MGRSVKVLVLNPVYSHDHKHVLIPDGTILLGEARKSDGIPRCDGGKEPERVDGERPPFCDSQVSRRSTKERHSRCGASREDDGRTKRATAGNTVGELADARPGETTACRT